MATRMGFEATRAQRMRICGDYKLTINPVLEIDQHPLPLIETLFTAVQGCKIFAKLDLSQAYQQVELDEKSRQLVTISTHKGNFRYTRLPFGVACAPAKFQKIMDSLLEGLESVSVFLDDVLIGGVDDDQLTQRLEAVLTRFSDVGLTLGSDKCELFKKTLKYLGFQIDSEGLHATNEKIKAVLDALEPKNVQELQSFLGFVNYLVRFIPKASHVLHPLYTLLRKNSKWHWGTEQAEAFKLIKQLVSAAPVLVHYNPELPLRLTVDASELGVGAVLSHVYEDGTERPLAFASRVLTQAESRYSQLDKEALAIVFGVRKFHMYLYGRHFSLVSDHKPLIGIFGPHKGIPTMAANRLQRWALFLSGYQYDLEYTSSKKNLADWLSRSSSNRTTDSKEVDLTVSYAATNVILPIDFNDVKNASKSDTELAKIMNYVRYGWPQDSKKEYPNYFRIKDELHLEQDVLMWGYRVVIPKSLQPKILEELHRSHMGMVKVKALARCYVWWPKINENIENMVKSCEGCMTYKDDPPKTTLSPWPWPEKPWDRLHIDYLGPFLGRYFLVALDAHSKWLEVFPTNSMTSMTTIEKLRECFARFGSPRFLVSDNYSAFHSAEFQNFLKANGIKHLTGAPFHPQTNGAAENAVRTVKRALKSCLINAKYKNISYNLSNFLMDYRNTAHSTTGVSPAQLLLGKSLRTRLDLLREFPCHSRVIEAQSQQITYYGGQRKLELNVGDVVWVSDYRGQNKKRVRGVVTDILGSRRFRIHVPECDAYWTRHVDQIWKT